MKGWATKRMRSKIGVKQNQDEFLFIEVLSVETMHENGLSKELVSSCANGLQCAHDFGVDGTV